MIVRYIVFTFMVMVLVSIQGCAQEEKKDIRFSELEKQVDSLRQEYHAPGLAIAVTEGERIVYTKGFGYSDISKKLPVDSNTIFGIGSATKAFTASVLGILEEEGRMKIRDKPGKYIPRLKFYNKEMDSEITIHHLLSHTTGISNMSSESSAVLFCSENPEDLVSRLQFLKPAAPVGKRLMYNNYMYTIAGLIGAKITGNRWEANLQHLIFEPLQMNRTFSSVKEASKHTNFSYGYAADSITPVRVLPEQLPTRAPAGDIFSSVNDMAKWLQLWLGEGRLGGKQIISPRFIRNATTPYLEFPLHPNDTTSSPSHYGYGWIVGDDHGIKRVEHSGGVSGYTSNVTFFPDRDMGIVVLTNQTGSSLAFAVTDLFVDKLLQRPAVDGRHPVQYSSIHSIGAKTTPTIQDEHVKLPMELDAYTGLYSHPGYGNINIYLKGATLYAEFPLTTFRLEYDSENDVFTDHFTEEIPLLMWNFMRFNFLTDASGKVSSVSLNYDEDPVIFNRITPKN